jgi:hypothetical protein
MRSSANGRIASEEVNLQLVASKCLLILMYGTEACQLRISDIRSLDFMVNRYLIDFLDLVALISLENVLLTLILKCRARFYQQKQVDFYTATKYVTITFAIYLPTKRLLLQ